MLSLFGPSYFVSAKSDLFWVERQQGVYCGMHAINNLFQTKMYTTQEWVKLSCTFTEIGRRVDPEYRSWTPRGSDPELLLYALQQQGYSSRNIKVNYEAHKDDIGVLFATRNHFASINRHDNTWYLLDSLSHQGVHGYYVGIKDLRIFLNSDKVLWAHMVSPAMQSVLGYNFLTDTEKHTEKRPEKRPEKRLEDLKTLLGRPGGVEELLRQIIEFETKVKENM